MTKMLKIGIDCHYVDSRSQFYQFIGLNLLGTCIFRRRVVVSESCVCRRRRCRPDISPVVIQKPITLQPVVTET